MRFIHTGDIHWGMSPDCDRPWSRERAQAIKETFEEVIRQARERDVDFLFIAGDLFHRQPLARDLKEVNYLFSTIPSVHVVLIAGNHDRIRKNSALMSFKWCSNVTFLMSGELESAVFGDCDVEVYGFSYYTPEILEARLDETGVEPNGRIQILAPSYHGTGTWIAGMGGRSWKLQRPDGRYLASQWGLIDGTWYLFGSDGYTGTGWKQVEGAWYYFRPDAAMATGWVLVDGHWYHLNGSGAMETGWVLVGGRWYYLDASGAMRTGWQNVSGTWYYLDGSGAMLANTMTPDGYLVDANGAWIH